MTLLAMAGFALGCTALTAAVLYAGKALHELGATDVPSRD